MTKLSACKDCRSPLLPRWEEYEDVGRVRAGAESLTGLREDMCMFGCGPGNGGRKSRGGMLGGIVDIVEEEASEGLLLNERAMNGRPIRESAV